MAAKKGPTVPDWESLRHLLAACRSGSLSEAARRLGVDHTTVSRRIRTLEEALGTPLFDRTPTGWVPTAAGTRVAADAERVEAAILALERATDAGGGVRGVVRLATTHQLATDVVVPAVPALRRRHPEVLLEIVTSNRTENLARREADLSLRFGRPREAGVVARRLGEIAHAFYAARVGRSTRALAPDEPFVGFDARLGHLEHEQWLAQVLPARRTVLRASTLASLVAAARAGVGVALLPCFVGDADVALARLESPLVPAPRELWLVVHPELRRAPRLRAVLDWLVETTAAMHRRFAGEPPL